MKYILISQILISYGEIITFKKYLKSNKKDLNTLKMIENLTQKKQHFKHLKKEFKIKYPCDIFDLNNTLELLHEERELNNNKLNKIIKKFRQSIKTIDIAISRFDFKYESEKPISQRGFAQIIRKYATTDIIDDLKKINTNDLSFNNLTFICNAVHNAIHCVNINDEKQDDKSIVVTSIFTKNAKKVNNAITDIKKHLPELNILEKMIGLPLIKNDEIPEPHICKCCNNERFVLRTHYNNDGNFYDCFEGSSFDYYEKCNVCNI